MMLLAVSVFPEGIKLGGYLENRTAVTFSEKESISNASLLRLESSKDFGTKGAFDAHLSVYSKKEPVDIFSNIRPESAMEKAVLGLYGPLLESLPPETLLPAEILIPEEAGEMMEVFITYGPYSDFINTDGIELDRAVLKLFFNKFDLYFGKQLIAWGAGYAFNPTDVWNMKNPMDPEAPKKGTNALRAEVPLGAAAGLSLVASTGSDFSHSSGGARLKGFFKGFDLSMSAMKVHTPDRELAGLPKKIMAGADMAGQVFDVGVWAEGAWNNPVYDEYTKTDSAYFQADAGLDYTFENGLYVLGEYFYNGLGKNDPDKYSGNDLINMFSGEMPGFGRNYAMAGLRREFFIKYNFSVFSLTNISDGSFMLLPMVEYSFSDNISVELRGQAPIGDGKKSEYGSYYGSLGMGVKGYF